MADEASSADETPVTFNVKSSNDAKYVITIPLSTTVAELKEKLAGEEYANIPADRQRLIYSGRVLKDTDNLAVYKVKDGNTVHLVKGAASNARQTPTTASAGSSTAAGGQPGGVAGVPTNFATGTAAGDPLAGLTGARYAGLAQLPGAGVFGPDGGMGAPPVDPEQMIQMLQDPSNRQAMNAALSNPQFLDMMINSNPMLRNMGPGVREMMQSEDFRRMMTDPETIRRMTQMQRMMGVGPFGAAGGGGFPAPGITDQTPTTATNNPTNPAPGANPPVNPFDLLSQMGGFPGMMPPAAGASPAPAAGTNPASPPNPFAMLFPPPAGGAQTGAQPGSPPGAPPGAAPGAANPFAAMQNPLLGDPAAARQFLQAMGLGEAMFGAAPTPPADTRPPEERYEQQLRQLNDMGFYDFDRNVEALRRTGGSVQGAVEYLLTH